MSEPQSDPSPEAKQPQTNRLALAGAAVVVAAVLLVTVYLAFFRQARGLHGQLILDGEPAAGGTAVIRVTPQNGGVPEDVTVEADLAGFFKISLPAGGYQLSSTLSRPDFVLVNGEELEMDLQRTPLGKTYRVEEGLTTIPALRVLHPGKVLGPLEGEEVMPDTAFHWTPYPNAKQYVLRLTFLPRQGQQAQASVFLPGDQTEWYFAMDDALGQGVELKVFSQLVKEHPTSALMPGGKYSWALLAYGLRNEVKDQAGPFTFAVKNDGEARDIAAASAEKIEEKRAKSMGALTGLVAEGRDVARNATFHVTLDQRVPDTGENRTLTDVEIRTDESGRYTVQVPPGLYRFIEASVRTGDSLYARVTGGQIAIVPPGSSAALFEVQAGQYAQVPDIQLRKRVQFIFPTPGAKVSQSPTVTWEPYPDANRYQLTLSYITPDGRPTNVWVTIVNSDRVDLAEAEFPAEFTKKYDHPAKGLKAGATYRVHLFAFKEPRRQREWDVTQPPSPWERVSESDDVAFTVEK